MPENPFFGNPNFTCGASRVRVAFNTLATSDRMLTNPQYSRRIISNRNCTTFDALQTRRCMWLCCRCPTTSTCTTTACCRTISAGRVCVTALVFLVDVCRLQIDSLAVVEDPGLGAVLLEIVRLRVYVQSRLNLAKSLRCRMFLRQMRTFAEYERV